MTDPIPPDGSIKITIPPDEAEQPPTPQALIRSLDGLAKAAALLLQNLLQQRPMFDGIIKALKRLTGKRGPSLKTIELGLLFQELKRDHPDFTREQVARQARVIAPRYFPKDKPLPGKDDVRNVYRAVGWDDRFPWKRGKRHAKKDNYHL